jgi:predicted outer membrane repeat protein
MTEGRIENNKTFSGGGVMVWGTSVGKCLFTMNGDNTFISNNVATGVNGSGNGGGVYVQEATFNFNQGTITRNVANRYGGGININETATLNLNGDCNITYNEAGAGGGISQEAGGCVIDIKSDGVLIEGNKAILNESTLESSATARGEGGGILIEKGTFRMSKGIIRNNDAELRGGGVSCYVSRIMGDVTAEITGGEISKNTAGISGGGVDLYADKVFDPTEEGDGNGSNHVNDVVVNLTGGILHSNSAKNGGGIYVGINKANSTAIMTINSSYTESTIYGNTATENGGAIGLNNGTVTVKSGNFSNNTAGNGGAIYLGTGNMSMNNIFIHENTATNSGGGVYLANGTLTIEDADNNKIIKNTAESTGGGIQVQDGALEMEKCLVQENKANYGGGVCVYNSAATTINLLNSAINFEKNTATTAGGGMAVLGPITLNFSGSLQHNSASNGGGIFVAQGAKLNYQGGMIRYNHAIGTSTGINTGYFGGANGIYGFGGGVFVGSNSKLEFNVTDGGLGFYGNDANTGGDDIFANGENTDVLLPVVGEMELTGFDIPVAKNGIFWVEDYMTNDVKYNLGPQILGASHSPIRYQDALKSAAVIGRLNDDEVGYNENRYKYLSLALGYELLFVRIVKQGLDPGDAAIVNVSYSKNGEISGSDWVPYQKALLVGPESGNAYVIVALPPNAWKFVEETAWSENYTATNATQKIKFDNQEQASAADVTFINTKKDKSSITVHDEANIENRMSPTP